MSIELKYNHLEQAYPDMLTGIGVLIQKGKLSSRFESVELSEEDIRQLEKAKELLDKKVSYSAIGRILGVHRLTVSSFVKAQNMQSFK